MIFGMRFQILALMASLAASTLAGYALAVPPTASPASPDRFAAVSDPSLRSAAIFTEFGNEMAWEVTREIAREDKLPADNCVPLRDTARSGDGLLERLIHRIRQGNLEGRSEVWTGTPGTTACKAP